MGPSRRGATAFLAAALLLRFAAAADNPPEPTAAAAPGTVRTLSVPSDEELERLGARIGEITISVADVFDPAVPGEDRKPFQLANNLHRNTRPGVVRSQLLFAPGDRYSARLLRETERLLRANKYLYDCVIRPVRYEDNVVDLDVWVKDVWTLKGGFAISRSGGVNSTRFDVQDLNFMGSGTALTLRHKDTVDRTSVSVRYLDRNVLGSRTRVSFVASDDSDGDRLSLEVGRPFYSLDSRWAAGFDGVSADRIDSLYSLGEIAQQFRHQEERFEVSGGLSRGLIDDRAVRLTFGLTYSSDRFADLAGESPAAALPEERTLVYPWVGVVRVPDSYAVDRNFDQLGRTEDVPLGTRYRALLGLAASAFGSDRDRAVFEASSLSGWKPSPAQTLLLSTAASGRWGAGEFEDLRISGDVSYYWRDFGPHLFFATLEAGIADNLDREDQLLLGGDSGLRGYPLRYQDGDARLLLTLEQRFFTGFQLFRIFWVGAAVFFDLGRTWSDADALSPNLGLLRDVGFGLRLGSSRSGFGSVIHFDVAFPLDGDDSIDSVQWLVTTKETF